MNYRRKLLPVILLLLGNILAIFIFLNFERSCNTDDDDLLEYANEIGDEIKKNITEEFDNTKRVVDNLKDSIEKRYSNSYDLFADTIRLKQELSQICVRAKHINGIEIGYENNREGDKNVFTVIYSHKINDSVECLNTNYVYADSIENCEEHTWFEPVLEKNNSEWVGPYLGAVGKKRFISYSASLQLLDSAFSNFHRKFVVSVDYSTTELYLFLNSIKSSRIGYPYILDKKGRFIAHPDNETKTLNSIAHLNNDKMLVSFADAIKNYDFSKGIDQIDPRDFYHENTVSKDKCWEMIFPLNINDWLLGFSVTDHQIISSPKFFNSQRNTYTLYALLFFMLVLITELLLIKRFIKETKMFLRLCSYAVSIALLIQLFFTFNYCLRYPIIELSDMELNKTAMLKDKIVANKSEEFYEMQNYDRWNFAMLLDNSRVEDFMDIFCQNNKKKIFSDLTKIPTGLYIQTIKFLDSHGAKLTGYVWQVCAQNSNGCGIIFPDAESCSMSLTDSQAVWQPNGTKAMFFRWYFAIEIREPFNYRVYPFDCNNLWIRLWSKDFDKNTLLTPDINSYLLFHPSFNPGIDKDIVVPGWNIEASYFSYKEKNYNTNFGANMDLTKSSFPELHYNIMLKRNHLDPIITRIIPLLVLLIMAFAILHMSKMKDALNVTIACSGLLFVAVFEHINLRKSLDMPGVMYMEYFYFTTYAFLLMVSVSGTINKKLATRFPNSILAGNFLKLLYWPLVLFLLLVFSVITFY